jgi:haloalkane dehalogenase
MRALRTPDERFAGLSGFPFAPRYCEIDDGDGGRLRVHYVDKGAASAPVAVLMHGEPTWSYLWRRVIPVLVNAGLRVIAPDLVGFGRSDKPTEIGDYTYARHVEWMRATLFDHLELRGISLVCHDWGGLIGLRLVAEHPDRFARVVATNTGLPDGEHRLPDAWWRFRDFVVRTEDLPISMLVAGGSRTELSPETLAAYDAPFPGPEYKAGAKAFPDLIPQSADNPATPDQQRAWASLSTFDKPFLMAFSDSDPITAGADRVMHPRIPGAGAYEPVSIPGGGHFVQEDAGPELARVIVDFIGQTS